MYDRVFIDSTFVIKYNIYQATLESPLRKTYLDNTFSTEERHV